MTHSKPEAVPAFSDDDGEEDFEPKIITDPNLKPKVDLEANKKKVFRSRYISTELGIAFYFRSFGVMPPQYNP